MVAHSSILAWKNPWTEEPGRLYSPMGWQRVGHEFLSFYFLVLVFQNFLLTYQLDTVGLVSFHFLHLEVFFFPILIEFDFIIA